MNREKLFLNGYEMWFDRDKLMLYDKKDAEHGIHLYSNHVTENERQQIKNSINKPKTQTK